MTKKLLFSLLVLALFSCRKTTVPPDSLPGGLLSAVLNNVRDSLSTTDYLSLDTSQAYLTPQGVGQPDLLRVGFRGKALSSDFVLLEVDGTGEIGRGSIVHLDNRGSGNGALSGSGSGPLSGSGTVGFNGAILISSLARQVSVQSTIENGYILAYHPELTAKITTLGTKSVDVVPASAGGDELPEVVIIGYVNGGSENGSQVSALLTMMMGPSSNGVNYSGGNGGSGALGSGGGSAAGTGVNGNVSTVPVVPYTPLIPGAAPGSTGIVLSPSLSVEMEYTNSLPAENISNVFKCFDAVPSKGATYSVTFCVDVPVNSNPSAAVSFSGTLSSGHTFLSATKTNGSISVTRSFGFYPQTSISAIVSASVPSAIKDNSNQEINAEYTVVVDSTQFSTFKSNAVSLSANQYSITGFNCSSYAMDDFNPLLSSSGLKPLAPPPLIFKIQGIPSPYGQGSPATYISIANSPQGLFSVLNQMKNNGGAQAASIKIDLTHNTKSPAGSGECN